MHLANRFSRVFVRRHKVRLCKSQILSFCRIYQFKQSFTIASGVSGLDVVILLDKIFAHLRIRDRTVDDINRNAEIF